MNLYLISQTENEDYDTYDSCVVCAANESEARQMSPGTNIHSANFVETINVGWDKPNDRWCSSPSLVTVKFIGVAAPDVTPGFICCSFNAG